jgi:hypothetical protein
MPGRIPRAALVVAGCLLLACAPKPGPDTFDKYARNEAGIRALIDYVKDTSNKSDDRVGAILAIIEAGWSDRTMTILASCPDRIEIAGLLLGALLDRLPSSEGVEQTVHRRDAAFTALRMIPESDQGPFQKRLAEWAFQGLTMDSTEEQVRTVTEPRATPIQIPALGVHGVGGAAILVRHGFDVDRLADYVVSQPDRKGHLDLLEAFRRLHSTPDLEIPFSHLEAMGRIRDVQAAIRLLDMANDAALETDIRAAAFNEAAGLMEDPGVLAGDRNGLLDRLRLLGASTDPDDRWSAAHFLMRLEGMKAFPEIRGFLKDDWVYLSAREDPMKTFVDFCKLALLNHVAPEEAWAAIASLLRSPNRVHQTLGVICVKASEDVSRTGLLSPLLGSRASLEGLLGERTTLGSLATNAREGLAMFAETNSDVASGRLSEPDAKLLRFAILVNLLDTGKKYRKAVADRFLEDRKEASK